MRRHALLEIEVEPLPACDVKPALAQLEFKTAAALRDKRLDFESCRAAGTPRRLAVIIGGLAPKAGEPGGGAVGPPAHFLKDADGGFTAQAVQFSRAHGVRPEDLCIVKTDRGEFLAVRSEESEAPAQEILETVFPQLIAGMEFPSTLSWEDSGARFARPIRGLAALFGSRVVPITYAGVRSNNRSRGLAALGSRPVRIPSASAYLGTLRDRCVLADLSEREAALTRGLEAAAQRAAGTPELDPALVERTVDMTEHPVALLCGFDRAFLDLPDPLVKAALKTGIDAFPIVERDGSLASEFIAVRDGVSEAQKEVREGFERAARTHLWEARALLERDRRTSLEEKGRSLASIPCPSGLGTAGDKAARVRSLSDWICESLLQDYPIEAPSLRKIALHAYSDLGSAVVRRFPELRGAMGAICARIEGLDERVALGLEELYYPAAERAPIPASLEGALVSLADKLDALAASAAGGAAHPPLDRPGLCAAALRILLEKQLKFPLADAVHRAVSLVRANGARASFDEAAASAELLSEFRRRMERMFLAQGFSGDAVAACRERPLDCIADIFRRVSANHRLRGEGEFPALQASLGSMRALLHAGPSDPGEVDRSLLSDPAETALFDSVVRLEAELREKEAQGRFEEGLQSLLRLRPDIDFLFEQVPIDDENERIARNRLAILARTVRLLEKYGV